MKKQKPPREKNVLCVSSPLGTPFVARLTKIHNENKLVFYLPHGIYKLAKDITHWMPLPTLPTNFKGGDK